MSRRGSMRMALSILALSTSVAAASQASAQTANPTPPPPPAGGYYKADGTRTAVYNDALTSWRNDAAFKVDYTKGFLGLEYAYVLGLSGRGQTIGINDSGVLATHPLFGGTGKFAGIRTGVPSNYGDNGLVNPRRPWEVHGTHVAGTAAGARIAGQTMFGNAFNANVLSATINFSAGDFLWWKDQILDGTTVSTPRQNIIDLANTGKVRIINNSWGSSTSVSPNITRAQAETAFRQNLNGFYDPILRNDVLVVFAAGNDGGAHASIDAVTPLNDLRLRSNWLSVVNYTTNTTGATVAAASTSLCGQTATWCLAGPGSAVVSSVNAYRVDEAAMRTQYLSRYPTLQTPNTLAGLNSAASNLWIGVLNGYLSRQDAAAAAGRPFDEAAEREFVAQQAVSISLAYGSRFVGGDPDGYTSNLANLLVSNGQFFTREFMNGVLTRANTLITAELTRLITYTGPGYGALTGTSMAAPNVSGMAALLMEWFPEYNTGLISDILLSSSRDLDTPGVDLRSGWGAPQMNVALAGPTALRETRTVTVGAGTIDFWTNNIQDARDRYSAAVLAGFPNDIGGLTKRGTGELILSGTNSYSGATRVEQGLLTVSGALTRSALTAVDGGTVGGTGTVALLTLGQGGILSPGNANAIGTLTVAGTAALGAGSQYIADVGVSGTSDLLVANRAFLQGGTLTLRPVGRLPVFGDSYTVLRTTDGISGTFGNTTSISAILYPEASYTPFQVNVRVAARPYTGVVANTPVQTSYARLLDGNRAAFGAIRGTTYDLLDLASVATIRSSLEAIAPRAETMRRAIGTTAIDNVARFYRDRIANLSPDSFAGGTLTMTGKPMEFAANAAIMPGTAAQVSDTSSSVVRENVLPSTVSAFLSGGYLTGSGAAMPGAFPQGTRDEFDGFYVASGIEAEVAENSVIGFGLSYSDIDGERNFGQSASGDLIQGTLYGRSGERFGLSADAQFSAGVYESRTRRTGTFAGTNFDLRSRDNALALSSEVGASYGVAVSDIRVAPRVAVRASRIDFTPTAERGTGPALFLDGDKFLSIQGRAGLTLDGDRGGLRPVASAYFVHDFQDRADAFQAGFVGGTTARAPFLLASQDRNWGEMSFGIAYRLPNGGEISGAADATFARKDVRNQSFRAGLKLPF